MYNIKTYYYKNYFFIVNYFKNKIKLDSKKVVSYMLSKLKLS